MIHELSWIERLPPKQQVVRSNRVWIKAPVRCVQGLFFMPAARIRYIHLLLHNPLYSPIAHVLIYHKRYITFANISGGIN